MSRPRAGSSGAVKELEAYAAELDDLLAVIGQPLDGMPDLVRVGTLYIDLRMRSVFVGVREVKLVAPVGFAVLAELASHAGTTFTAEELASRVSAGWRLPVVSLQKNVYYLRERLGPAAPAIETVSAGGYRLRPSERVAARPVGDVMRVVRERLVRAGWLLEEMPEGPERVALQGLLALAEDIGEIARDAVRAHRPGTSQERDLRGYARRCLDGAEARGDRLIAGVPAGPARAPLKRLVRQLADRSAALRAVLAALERAAARSGQALLEAGELRLDLIARRAVWRGKELQLTHTAFLVLAGLAQSAGDDVDAETLARRVWPDPDAGTRRKALALHVSKLRRKLGQAHDESLPIRTVRGGYRFDDPATAPGLTPDEAGRSCDVPASTVRANDRSKQRRTQQ